MKKYYSIIPSAILFGLVIFQLFQLRLYKNHFIRKEHQISELSTQIQDYKQRQDMLLMAYRSQFQDILNPSFFQNHSLRNYSTLANLDNTFVYTTKNLTNLSFIVLQELLSKQDKAQIPVVIILRAKYNKGTVALLKSKYNISILFDENFPLNEDYKEEELLFIFNHDRILSPYLVNSQSINEIENYLKKAMEGN